MQNDLSGSKQRVLKLMQNDTNIANKLLNINNLDISLCVSKSVGEKDTFTLLFY